MEVLKCSDDSVTVKGGCDTTDAVPNSYSVTKTNFASLIFSIFLHCLDCGLDIYVAYSYFQTGRYSYGVWSIVFISVPAVVLTLMSISMYLDDLYKDKITYTHSTVRIVFCVLGAIVPQSAPLIRNLDALYLAIKSKIAEIHGETKKQEAYFTKMLTENSDTAFLKAFEGYLESAPQQVLQLTLLLRDYSQGSYTHSTRQIFSVIISFISMGFCLANLNRSLRFEQKDKSNMTPTGLLVYFLWNLFFIVSRILAISQLASLFPYWTCVALLVHCFVMSILLAVSKSTNFCCYKIFEIGFSFTVGVVYIFAYINLKSGPTRNYYFCFFLITFVENTIATVIWGMKCTFKTWVYYFFLILSPLFFILGVIFIIVYYQFLHPKKINSSKENDKTNQKKENDKTNQKKENDKTNQKKENDKTNQKKKDREMIRSDDEDQKKRPVADEGKD